MNPGPAAEAAKVLVVMGVSGSGKSTIASMLAQRLHWIYEDGDWFHPKSNLEKMHHGEPLNDEELRRHSKVLLTNVCQVPRHDNRL